MPINTLVDLKDCPFCGGKEGNEVSIGAASATSWAVSCTCGAKVVEEMYNEYPNIAHALIKKISKAKKLDMMESFAVFHMLNVAEKWNKRV